MQYTLTLTRWHKVAERINAALRERETDVKAAFTATAISPWNKEGVEEKAADIARRGADDLALIEVGARAVAHIRTALAIRNAELGVSAKLAEAESANRAAALYKAIIEGQKADMVRPESVRALPAGIANEADTFSFGRRTRGCHHAADRERGLRRVAAREARARAGASHAAARRGRRSESRETRDRRAAGGNWNCGTGGVSRQVPGVAAHRAGRLDRSPHAAGESYAIGLENRRGSQ